MLAKTNQKNKPWTEEDNAWAIKQHDLRRTNYYIAKKIGRTEAAVQVHLSKMRTKSKKFIISKEIWTGTTMVTPVADKPKRKDKMLAKSSAMKAVIDQKMLTKRLTPKGMMLKPIAVWSLAVVLLASIVMDVIRLLG